MNVGFSLCSFLFLLCKTQAGLIAPATITDEVKKNFVELGHTRARGMVDPPATDMKPMKWNDELARSAQDYVNTCPEKDKEGSRHSSRESRQNVAGFSSVGESYDIQGVTREMIMAQDLSGDEKAVAANALIAQREWWIEHKNYDYENNLCTHGMCGHYTAMIWANTTDIGCGIAMCSNVIADWHGWFTLCRYGPAGNVVGASPYKSGAGRVETRTREQPKFKASSRLIAPVAMTNNVKPNFVILGHTIARNNVDPPATNMKPMKWNDQLQKSAQDYVNTCPEKDKSGLRHSSKESRQNVAGFRSVGESYDIQGVTTDRTVALHLADDEQSVVAAARLAQREWWVERVHYDYANNRCSGVCGHYTAMVWANTTDIGCGMAMCADVIDNWHGWFTICHYGPAGNMQGERPYKS